MTDHQAGEPVSPDTVDSDTPGQDDGTVAELQARVTELEGRWRAALADLDNLRKRSVREMGNVRENERVVVAGEWLPVLDNLDAALAHALTDPVSIIEGVRADIADREAVVSLSDIKAAAEATPPPFDVMAALRQHGWPVA